LQEYNRILDPEYLARVYMPPDEIRKLTATSPPGPLADIVGGGGGAVAYAANEGPPPVLEGMCSTHTHTHTRMRARAHTHTHTE